MPTQDELRQQYAADAHAMQTGISYESEFNRKPLEPKHLRVGVNAAMCDHAGLVKLLIAKGIITELEYLEAIAAEMAAEKTRYEQRLSDHYGVEIKIY